MLVIIRITPQRGRIYVSKPILVCAVAIVGRPYMSPDSPLWILPQNLRSLLFNEIHEAEGGS